MRVALYARVSTTRQAQAQGIEQQLDRLRAAVSERGWELDDRHVYRDDGYSGARIGRPGLDRLRDHAALAELDLVLVTAPDRLARNYVHQVLLIEELAGHGCQVEFLDRPMSADPHDQLLLQIRGAVAGRGDRRRSRGVGGDGRFAEGVCQARHGGDDGTCGRRPGYRDVPAGADRPGLAPAAGAVLAVRRAARRSRRRL